MHITQIEQELQARLAYPYRWGTRQNDSDDKRTNFVYSTPLFSDLLARLDQRFGQERDGEQLFNYALNRWYNFWSAQAIERIFCESPFVLPHTARDRLVDFWIDGVAFDHKTSVFPKRYQHSISYAQRHPQTLLTWFYHNQSRQRRYHLGNRLFVVLHASDSQHWRLKAEVSWLRSHVEYYLRHFDPTQLHTFAFTTHTTTRADVIWAVA